MWGVVIKKTIKMKAKVQHGTGVVKFVLTHPMETGRRVDAQTKQFIPAHFIERVYAEYQGEIVFEGLLGSGVAKNPFLSFFVADAQIGQKITLTWVDNLRNTDTSTATFQ